MPYARKRFAKKRAPKRGYKKYTKKAPRRTNASLVKTIKSVVMRQAETKHSGVDEVEYVMATSNNTLFPSVNLSSWAGLATGTLDGQRVGNKISVTKANLNLIIRRNNTVSSLYPCEVHIWIGYMKQERNAVPDAYFGQIYQDGGSVLPWNGSMLRTLRKNNTDLFTIFKKMVFKIGPATTTGPSFINNDFPIMQRKVISLKPLLGTLTYGDDGSSSNFNKDLWMWASYVYIDDTIDNLAVSPALKPIDILYFVDVEYKDM